MTASLLRSCSCQLAGTAWRQRLPKRTEKGDESSCLLGEGKGWGAAPGSRPAGARAAELGLCRCCGVWDAAFWCGAWQEPAGMEKEPGTAPFPCSRACRPGLGPTEQARTPGCERRGQTEKASFLKARKVSTTSCSVLGAGKLSWGCQASRRVSREWPPIQAQEELLVSPCLPDCTPPA